MKQRRPVSVKRFLFPCLATTLALGVAACASNERAEEGTGVFVEIERPEVGEIGSSRSIFDPNNRTERVELTVAQVEDLETRGRAPQIADAPRARADYCPRVRVLSGTGVLTAYATGGEDTEQDIAHQATITRSGRECSNVDGQLQIRVGAAGRAVQGPKATDPNISLPIRVAVLRNDTEVLFSRLYEQPISFAGTTAQGFTFIEENVSVPFPEQENLKVIVGFDTERGADTASTGQNANEG